MVRNSPSKYFISLPQGAIDMLRKVSAACMGNVDDQMTMDAT